jgi:phage baseplate assembly protein W
MDEARIFGQGFAFPPRLGPDGRVALSAGPENIREAIRIILLTEPGERLMLPELGAGLARFLFQPNTVATHRLIEERIVRALSLWEPRIRLESVTVEADAADAQSAAVTIRYALVATGASDRIDLSVRLAG